jgi:hypothetical protein
VEAPFIQVLMGELLGVAITVVAILLCSRLGSDLGIISVFTGTIIIVGFIAMFFMGEWNLYFSTNVAKNILIVAMYEEIICVVSAFLALLISGISSSNMNNRDVVLIFVIIFFIASALFGEQCFYKEIVKAYG